ncbi:MAG: hypothetical protein ACM3ZF_02130 [Mycobacterium leprae]
MRPGLRLALFSAAAGVLLVLASLVGAAVRSDRGRSGGGSAPAPPQPSNPSTHAHDLEPATAGTTPSPAGLSVDAEGYQLLPETTRLAVGRRAAYRFSILDAGGSPVHAFVVEQTKMLHLIVVRRDFAGFQHLHPELAADGSWSTPLTLPEAGTYRVFADFRPRSLDHSLTLGTDLFAGPGAFRPRPLPEPDQVTNTADGHAVSLRRDGDSLTFVISKGDEPVRDLQPYLGAYGHLVALRAGDLAYSHVHPVDGRGRGPEISFRASFPGPGFYRLFLQFQRAGTLHLATMTIEVPE